jgi:spore maturation protein SpmA
MGKMFKNAVKTGIAFFLIGMTLALVGPAVAETIGFTGEALASIVKANEIPVWTGTFFGMFGALSQVVPPLVDRIFGDVPSTHNQQAQIHQNAPSKALENSQSLDIPQLAMEQSFASKIKAERAAHASMTIRD